MHRLSNALCNNTILIIKQVKISRVMLADNLFSLRVIVLGVVLSLRRIDVLQFSLDLQFFSHRLKILVQLFDTSNEIDHDRSIGCGYELRLRRKMAPLSNGWVRQTFMDKLLE